ncbi:MAG TPA: 4-hydroxy-tetrahydrodipicolinate reductase [Steroidobacteraceae bacterium]|nr:4-hydroxy-tetrahydrodipicolinate reductase [Steroidobacteraceae bacterium]
MRPQALTVFGITGRMGQSLIRALREGIEFELRAAIASVDSARLGEDAAADGPPTGVAITADPDAGLHGAAVALDFSVGSAVAAHAQACARSAVPLLVGATGFDATAQAALQEAAKSIAVLVAPNTSLGVAVLNELTGAATRALGSRYDVDISEAHHRHKRDAPSGTALNLGETIARSRAVSLDEVAVFERHGMDGPRRPGSIGFSVVRAGDIVGEHTVTFTGEGETLQIFHRATDRITFARGALRGAGWLIGRPAGLYAMHDVLGI